MSLTPAESEGFTMGEAGRALVRIEGDVREVKAEIKTMSGTYVTRAEYDVREQSLNREITGIRAALDSGIADLKSQRPMWWQVAPFIIAAMSLTVVLIPLIAK